MDEQATEQVTEAPSSTNGSAHVTLPVSMRDLVRFTPEDRAKEPEPPVYMLQHWTLRTRTLIEQEQMMLCGRPISQAERKKVCRAAVLAMLEGDEQAHAHAVMDECFALVDRMSQPGAAELDDAEKARNMAALEDWDQIHGALSREYAPLARLLAHETLRTNVWVGLMVKYTLRGWVHVDHPFELERNWPSEATLDAIPPADLVAIALEANRLKTLSVEQRKN